MSMGTVAAELVAKDWLEGRFPAARLCTETPADLEQVLPCIRVGRIGGGRESFPAFDGPTLDIDTFAPTRAEARTLAHEVGDAILFELPGVSGVLRAAEFTGPTKAPWTNPKIVRFTASYTLRIHSTF